MGRNIPHEVAAPRHHEVAVPMRLTAEPTMRAGGHNATAGANPDAAADFIPFVVRAALAIIAHLMSSVYEQAFLLWFPSLYVPAVASLFDAYGPYAAAARQTVWADDDDERGASPSPTRAEQRFENQWRALMRDWKSEWLQMSVVNASLFALIVFFLQFCSARIVADPMTNVVAHLALVAALNGIWASTLYFFLFHQASCHGVKAAVRWTESAAKRTHYKFTATPHILATPAVATTWSLCLFITFVLGLTSGIFTTHVGPLDASLDTGASLPLAGCVLVSLYAILAAVHMIVNVYCVTTMSRGGNGAGPIALEDDDGFEGIGSLPPLAFVRDRQVV